MTRKRWIKLNVALAVKVNQKTGFKTTGETLKYYRDFKATKDFKSPGLTYENTWENLKLVREFVGM